MTDDPAPPAGFEAYHAPSPYMRLMGPMFLRPEPDGRRTLGLWLREQHANLHGVAHGGMLAAVADNALGYNLALLKGSVVTVNLSLDFLAPAPVGTWLEARVEYRRLGGRLAFGDALLHAGGVLVARATGVLASARGQG
ncbi:PaaI family thioesterase [Aquabacterium sp. J223]|uniref:PaaI family thioesterase n=1 Tax=Aquabacterium sp. J223 TaxID=2898431 RepID=UPI0021AD94E5|nr:PaaI family thioesterase [Aquabacterium sp. J223]UUX97099.1 PaaI family thioesterase [Aquabacterium sp. J223]